MQETLFPLHYGTAPTPEAPHAGTPTSREAAEEIKASAGRLRALVHEFIIGKGDAGATDCEVQSALAMQGSTERPRRRELVQALLVRDSGRTRPTPSGRQATVWVAVNHKQETK